MKNDIHGWIILNKARGLSSNQVLGKIKRLLNPKKAGYIGTLDPEAEGVLPIALGDATKVITYIGKEIKAYEFDLQFGYETDTFDLEGQITSQTDFVPDKEQLEEALSKFTGVMHQKPPMYSAIKINGKRAYKIARAGGEVDIPSREIEIYKLELLSYDKIKNLAKLYVLCTQGTYVRSIGVDLARYVKSMAVITHIKRVRSGKFLLSDSILLEDIEKIVYDDARKDFLKTVEFVLDDIPVIKITEQMQQEIKFGKEIKLPDGIYGCLPHMVKYQDKIIAIGYVDQLFFKPKRVFNI